MLTVVIQAGGQSSRMGQDKALMPFLGRPLIERLVDRLSGLGSEVLVTTNRPEAYAFLNLPLYADLLPGMGALGGLYTALHSASHPLVAVVACDMPFASPKLLAAQADMLEREGVDVVVPNSANGFEPLHAVYRRDACLPAVRAALDQGRLRMVSWFPDVRVRVLRSEEAALYDPYLRAFDNVNSPEEFARAEALARQDEAAS